jgi:hypothetical protein
LAAHQRDQKDKEKQGNNIDDKEKNSVMSDPNTAAVNGGLDSSIDHVHDEVIREIE